MDDDSEFKKALFKFSLISPLLHLENDEDKKRTMEGMAGRELEIPDSKKKKITGKTLSNYLKRYKDKGFDGLKRKPREDKNKLKSISDEILELIIKFKKEEPKRSARQIIRLIQAMAGYKDVSLKERTVSRILKNNNLTRRDLVPKRIYKSFEMEHINDLWEVDASDGLYLQTAGRKTYLIAFIDDFSRIIPHAQFYFDEKLPRLEDCLKKAILKRGIPNVLYADNGKIFLSNHLKRICAEMGIRLINHLPYSPQSKGKIERFFLRLKSEFLLEAKTADIQSIEELNSFLIAWIEIEYHRKEHHALGVTPLERYIRNLSKGKIRTVESMEEITEIFLYREQRQVHPSKGIVRLSGNGYQVTDHSLLGKSIEARFDPFDLSRVFVYNNGVFKQIAYPARMNNPLYIKIPEENHKSEKTIRNSSVEFFARLKQKEQELHQKENKLIDFTKLNKEN